MHLRYAEEIAARAMHRHRGTMAHAEWLQHLFTIAKSAFEHPGKAVHVVVSFYVRDRFRQPPVASWGSARDRITVERSGGVQIPLSSTGHDVTGYRVR